MSEDAPKFFTRSEFLNNECTLAEYYRSILHELGINFEKHEKLEEFRVLLEEGDKHLNRIPLSTWDLWGAWRINDPRTHTVFRERGDSVSLAGLVCLHKQAARDAVRRSNRE